MIWTALAAFYFGAFMLIALVAMFFRTRVGDEPDREPEKDH